MAHKSPIRDHLKKPNIDQIQDSIKLVKDGMLSLNSASKLIGVPRKILYHRLQSYINEGKDSKLHETKLRVTSAVDIFTQNEEVQLLKNIKDYVWTYKVFSLKAVQEVAYHFAKQLNKTLPFSWEEHKMASVNWLQKFRKRYDGYILFQDSDGTCIRIVGPPRDPETSPSTLSTTLPSSKTSPSPTKSLTTFQSYKAAMDKYPLGLPPTSIWNIDEITLYNPSEILTKEMQSFSAVSSESNLTIISAVNAGGNTIPPMMIFPNVDYTDFVLDGAPPETIGAMNSSGGPNEDLFLEFFRHFLRYAKPSKDIPCIVLLDNHESHMCVPVNQLAKEKGVILITFQPNESHKVQPIEEEVSEVFKVSYNNAGKELLSHQNNVGRKLYTRDISTLVGKAFAMAFTPTNIMKGFRVSGFYPLNENKHTDLKSSLSNVTDRFAGINQRDPRLNRERSSVLFQDTDDPLSSPSQRYTSRLTS